ncbi:MAG: response regulator [Pirellulaceae bacterium]|nr:response regulator [Pirellulaceae bacterium]
MSLKRSSRRAKPDILVVDDTPANLQVLTGLLQERGYKVRPVPNGRLAVQAARSLPPDLILLDIKMPEMDGFEVCRQLKADPRLREIPVVFLSALSETSDKVLAFAAGGVDYVTKPFQIEEVEARVRTHLQIRHLQQELEEHNQRLEELVQQRTRQLAESNARLAVLDKTKSDFLRLISHELRTPLSGVLGIAELAFRECGDQPMALQLRTMFEQARGRIITLLEDALLLTEIELTAESISREACPLNAILQAALEQARPLALARGVRLPVQGECSGRVYGRNHLLVRAMRSLLETAVKFCVEGESVRWSQVAAEKNVRIVIEATGRHIPHDMLPQFFDVLAIRDSITPGGDLGLGPAVAERIVAALGGSVRVENTEPAGIRLDVELPADADSPS